MADVPSGTFDGGSHEENWIKQTAGEPVDPSVFAALGLILLDAAENRESPSEVIRKVEPISPKLAKRLRAVADDPSAFSTVLAALIGGFAAIAAAVIATHGNQSPPTPPVNIIIQGIDPTSFDRTREDLNRIRDQRRTVPDWAGDFI